MRISHFNSHSRGGSAMVMLRLHAELVRQGHGSEIYSRQEGAEGTGLRILDFCGTGWKRLAERAGYSIENRMVRQPAATYVSRTRLFHGTPAPADGAEIAHLHWVSRWLDLPSFVASLPPKVPVVWTIHDMSPLAGGCFTDFGCAEYDNDCKRCPVLKFPFDRVLPRREVNRRRAALAGRRIAVAANSHSTLELARRSSVFRGAEMRVIHPGVDFSALVAHDKAAARRTLGIGPEGFLLGFGAAALTDRNKGIDRFFEVARRLCKDHADLGIILFGEGDPPDVPAGIPIHRLGRLSSPERLALAMSAMDVFVVASQMETFGQVAVEAQACGTPVWAFEVGGLPETLIAGETGGLAAFGDIERMAGEIGECRRNGKLRQMGVKGSEWVRGRFSVERTTGQYVELYRELLAKRDVGAPVS